MQKLELDQSGKIQVMGKEQEVGELERCNVWDGVGVVAPGLEVELHVKNQS